ncbi:MAG: annexin, partial [Ilumatobacteraceae bacterium]
WGTDEEAIFAVLTGRSAAERREIGDWYLSTYDRTLEADLRDEMSGSELDEALRLLTQGELSHADEVYQAIIGAGTDEARVTRVLEGLGGDQAAVNRLIADYAAKYGGLLGALNGDLSGDELAEARRLLGQAGHAAACREVLAGADPDLLHHVEDFTFLSVADRLSLVGRIHTETVVGGSDEDVLERIWSAPDMAEPAAQNQALYQESRNRGAELPEGLTTFGRFENRFEQDMFEGGTTVGEGLFDWTLVGDLLDVRVPIDFEPAEGVTAPYATWNGEIDGIWNQFAVVEPGGRKIRLVFSMINDSSASRTVEVVKNKTPGTWTPDDRANAGMFFEVMQSTTVPHEFGHFIGLPDEYQRTHDDFIDITGTTKTGPANTSGDTEAEIADELHTALHLDDQPKRRIEARKVLTAAGLIVTGIPQQGDFAQEVMTQYDDRHGTLKDDLIDQLDADVDSGDRWLLQTVFSYASATVMGNPTIFGIHTHPVEPRHLREFVSIVQRRHPTESWSIGPK